MARRKRHEEHTNHESWAIPYGDLVTLLLAFFVVMYAMASGNEGKYRILSDSLVAALRAAPKSMEPIQVGDLSRSLHEIRTQHTRTLVPLEIESFRYEWEDEEALPLDEFGLEYMRGGGLS